MHCEERMDLDDQTGHFQGDVAPLDAFWRLRFDPSLSRFLEPKPSTERYVSAQNRQEDYLPCLFDQLKNGGSCNAWTLHAVYLRGCKHTAKMNVNIISGFNKRNRPRLRLKFCGSPPLRCIRKGDLNGPFQRCKGVSSLHILVPQMR